MSGSAAAGRDMVRVALGVAGQAPSLHDSQPWRWQLVDRALQLWADRHGCRPSPIPRAGT